MNARTALAVFSVLTLLFITSCQDNEKPRKDQGNTPEVISGKDYLSLVISLDTLSSVGYKKVVYREDSLLRYVPVSNHKTFYFYFRERRYLLRSSRTWQWKRIKRWPEQKIALK